MVSELAVPASCNGMEPFSSSIPQLLHTRAARLPCRTVTRGAVSTAPMPCCRCRYAVQPDDMKQVFSMRASAPPGGYLRVRLQGKAQQQWEDAQLYLAVR